jgi:ectoine hydroxylase-related dioxygenase (phytanoyl-CoA dioxygenase family)
LVGVSRLYTSEIIIHTIFQAVADKFLTTKQWFWEGLRKQWSTSKPQLNNNIVFSIAPGAAAHPLHRDDAIHQRVPTSIETYPEKLNERETGVGFFVAAKKATKENGATRFIPGSHLWAHETPPDESLCQYAEMEKGDAFIMLASCFHGGSANTTADEERVVFSCFYTRSWMRQEENQYLANDWDRIRALPDWLQERVGWGLSRPFLGWVNLSDPMKLLHPERETNKDLF